MKSYSICLCLAYLTQPLRATHVVANGRMPLLSHRWVITCNNLLSISSLGHNCHEGRCLTNLAGFLLCLQHPHSRYLSSCWNVQTPEKTGNTYENWMLSTPWASYPILPQSASLRCDISICHYASSVSLHPGLLPYWQSTQRELAAASSLFSETNIKSPGIGWTPLHLHPSRTSMLQLTS